MQKLILLMGPLLEGWSLSVSLEELQPKESQGRAGHWGATAFQLTLVASQQLLNLSQPFQRDLPRGEPCPGPTWAPPELGSCNRNDLQSIPEACVCCTHTWSFPVKHVHVPLNFPLTNEFQIPLKSSLTKTDPMDPSLAVSSSPGRAQEQTPTGSVPARTFF